jgi:flagellin
MKELTIQGRNGSYNTSQRKTLSDEILALRDEINAIAERTTFNNLSLLKTALRSSVAITNLVDEVKGDGNIFTGTQAGTQFVLEDIKLDNANVGQYNIVSAADGSSITITAIASTTGLSGTSQSNPVGLSQSVNFADIARHEWSNNDAWDASNPTMNVASSATVTVNFDRLGISFVLRNTSNASETLERFETIAETTMTLGAGTMQAVFQGGANTRDTFVVTGFKDVRLFDRNLNSDAGDEDTYRVFSRLNDVIKTIEPQTDNVLSAQNFEDLANRVEDTLKVVTEIRSNLGAQTNRIEFAISNIQAQTEGMTAALGRIRDTDYAAETANLTKNQILQQAATAMLAQANQMPNVVLSLLQ